MVAKPAMGKAMVEAVSGMMCKGVPAKSVPAEAVPSKSAATVCVTTVCVAPMVSPSEPAPLTPFVVTSSAMSKFVSKPAAAVMAMPAVESAVKSAVPGPAKSRMSAVIPVSMTFEPRPAMPAASASVTAKAVVVMMTMVVVTVIASPGQSIAMAGPFSALTSMGLTLAALVPVLGPLFSVTLAAESLAAKSFATATLAAVTLAMTTGARLFVPHVAVGVASASATLGVFARSPFTMFSLASSSVIAFGELAHATAAALAGAPLALFSVTPFAVTPFAITPLSKLTPAVAAPAASRPRSLVGVVAIRIAVAPSGIVSPRSAGPFASSLIAVGVAIVATIVSHFVRADFVRRQSSPIPVGRELHQSGRRDSAKKQQHVSSHFRLPFTP
jgi:hypothetical protein